MKWFGRKAAAREARPVLARAGWSGGLVGLIGGWGGEAAATDGWPGGYEAQLRAAMLGNPVAQRCARLVSEGAGAAAIKALGGVEEDRAAALVLVARRVGGQSVIEALSLSLLLHGNGYAQIGLDGLDRPARLYPLRPERVSVEADARGWPVAYRYRVGDDAARLEAEDGAGRTAVIHVRSHHPLDDHYGLGVLGAAAGAVAIHNAATRWNKALLDNAARPSGALIHAPADGAPLSPDQFDRLKAEMEALFSGSANAGRPMLLEGGLSWQAMSLTPADMDFVGLKSAAAREIALAFGVPSMLIGLPGDNAYANYREANKALWRQTILPLADRILGALSQGLEGWFPGVSLRIDIDRLSVLADERAAMWEQVAGADFLTTEEKRGMLGLCETPA